MTFIPPQYSQSEQIGVVDSFYNLLHQPFKGKINAYGFLRQFDANFREIIEVLNNENLIVDIAIDDLKQLTLSPSGEMAKQIIIEDFQRLQDFGAQPNLNIINSYPKDDEFDFISTDVYSFHVDRSPIPTSTILCTYFGASSDIIANNQVVQKIKVPTIREQLKSTFNLSEDEIEIFAVENYFDMHFHLLSEAKPINLGNHHIWRLAVDHPNQQVLPCVHRAPTENVDEPRLLLIC